MHKPPVRSVWNSQARGFINVRLDVSRFKIKPMGDVFPCIIRDGLRKWSPVLFNQFGQVIDLGKNGNPAVL